MLYTSMPLERIYTNMASSMLIPRNSSSDNNSSEMNENKLEYRMVDIPHGKVHAKLDGENYIVYSVNSTDMSDYLNDKYILGSILSEK